MLAICFTSTMPIANICYVQEESHTEETMIDVRLTVDTREERHYTLEVNGKRLLELLRDAGFNVPDDATVRVGETDTEIDFDTLLQVHWSDTENSSDDYDSEPDIKGVIG